MSAPIERLHVGLVTLKLGLGVTAALFVASLLGAVALPLSGNLFVDMALWAAGVVAVLGGAAGAARALRRARFGPTPPSWEIGVTDLLADAGGALGGVLLLIGFVPRVLAGGDAWDAGLLALGALLLAGAIWSWFRYWLRR